MEKYCRAGQVIDDKMTIRTVCWIPNAIDAHSECVIPLFFRGKNGCKNGPQYYVIVHCLFCYILILLCYFATGIKKMYITLTMLDEMK